MPDSDAPLTIRHLLNHTSGLRDWGTVMSLPGATVDGDKAFIKQRPATSLEMQPIYKDHFQVEGYVVWFTRDKNGKINGMHVGASRMHDMSFVRVR